VDWLQVVENGGSVAGFSGFRKRQLISGIAESFLISQIGLCFMKLVSSSGPGLFLC
jgi:hypothetical protein